MLRHWWASHQWHPAAPGSEGSHSTNPNAVLHAPRVACSSFLSIVRRPFYEDLLKKLEHATHCCHLVPMQNQKGQQSLLHNVVTISEITGLNFDFNFDLVILTTRCVFRI